MNALTNANFIPFERELSHVEAYLRLEQMRMGERLNVVYDIQEKAFFIPPLLLQPLVENAVKHGIFYKDKGGTVTIRTVKTDRKITISVMDDGVGFEAAAREEDFHRREHHGLVNVRSRVEKMLGGTLRVESHGDQGSTVTLEFHVNNPS
jgi:sensor histidine kinase YesM